MMRADVKRLNEAEHVWVAPDTGEVINIDRAWQESDKRIAISRKQQALLAAAGESGPTARWYVLQVKRGADIAVDKLLEEASIEHWTPSQTIQPKRQGGRKGPKPDPKVVPFLPGYLFVKVVWCAPCWEAISGLKGVAGVIGTAEKPAPVPDNRLLKLRAFVEKDPASIQVLTKALVAGDKVRVDDGPFASFPGVVERVCKNGRALVEVMIFGRAVSADLELAQISKSE
jgi:transcription antitermination factor NusG